MNIIRTESPRGGVYSPVILLSHIFRKMPRGVHDAPSLIYVAPDPMAIDGEFTVTSAMRQGVTSAPESNFARFQRALELYIELTNTESPKRKNLRQKAQTARFQREWTNLKKK